MRSGKGRLRVGRGGETEDIKVRIEKEVAEELRKQAKRLGVPMAKIVREGIEVKIRELKDPDKTI